VPRALPREYCYLVYRGGGSDKFYEVILNDQGSSVDREVIMRWGRHGSDGQTLTQVYAGRPSAWHFFTAKIRSKIAKGYIQAVGLPRKDDEIYRGEATFASPPLPRPSHVQIPAPKKKKPVAVTPKTSMVLDGSARRSFAFKRKTDE
jgi:predicted DNA-binding WGR domain protein